MPDVIESFHFLRPAWLWLLPAVAVIWLIVHRQGDSLRAWRQVIAPHLLDYLVVRGSRGWRFQPVHLIVGVMTSGILALAGPTWQHEVSPFAEDTAPLIVALDLSQSMNAVDISPTRLERAKLKIHSLFESRNGARNGLIVYAGTAHSVVPLSDDSSLLNEFVASLGTGLMPVPGKDPRAALELADGMLRAESVPGSILFLTDGIATEYAADFAAHAGDSRDEVLVLAIGTPEGAAIRIDDDFVRGPDGQRLSARLDVEGLQALEDSAGIYVAGITADDSDLSRIERRFQSHLQDVRQEDESARWKDAGYALTTLVALLVLLWFRKGWTIRWAGAVAAGMLLGGCGNPGSPVDALLLSADQQGQRLFDAGRFAEAADVFEDPAWRGAALYRAGEYAAAIDSLVIEGTVDAEFNIGNAYAQLGRYEDAVASYESVVGQRPDRTEARVNLALVSALIKAPLDDPKSSEPGGDPNQAADEFEFDEKGKQGKAGEIDEERMSNEQLTEMWMRRLQTTPADFLKFRFAAEVSIRQQEDSR